MMAQGNYNKALIVYLRSGIMKKQAFEYIKKNTWCLYVLFALLQLAFMFYQCGKQSMWLDEMSFMGTITKDKSLKDILWQYLSIDVTNLPLFPLIAAVWYRIMPANDRLMLLLPEIFAAGALIVTSSIAERNFGRRAGIITAVLMFISKRSVLNCGFELRAYSCMLFLSALLLLQFFERRKRDRVYIKSKDRVDIKQEVLYCLTILLLLFTHYSGAILIAVLGMVELFLILCKHKSLKTLIPYIAAGILFSPWFLLMLRYKEKSIGSFWVDPPTIPEISRTLKYLLSENEAVFIVFIITLIIIVWRLAYSLHKSEKPDERIVTAVEMSAVIFIMIIGVFMYSAVVNPGGGIFLKRYFLVLLPLILPVTSFGMVYLQDIMSEGRDIERKYEMMFVITVFTLIYFGLSNIADIRETSGSSWETFREAAAYVREQGVLDDGDNAVLVCSVNPRATAGFAEYYVRHGGRENEIDAVSLQGDDPVSELSKYDKIYLVYVHRDLEDLDPDILNTLNRDFKLTAEDESVKAAVYERIQR